MSKRSHVRIKLSDYKERKADEGAIDIELDDGSLFRIPPPELWPDEVMERTRTLTKENAHEYPLAEQARDIVGAEEWARFTANGGTAVLFHSLLKEDHGADLGESSAS